MAALNRHPASRAPHRGERGQVLLIAAVLGLLAMGLWMLAWRSTHDAIRLERIAVQRHLRADTAQRALAQGLALLRTGRPPFDDYSCQTTIASDTGDHVCAVTYISEGSEDDWSVEARLATESEQANLPTMPSTF
jgi:hypothetical protein